MKEGFQIVTVPAYSYKTCLGCKYLDKKMARSGRNPLYNCNCTHPSAPRDSSPLYKANISFMSDEQPAPPSFCPFL